jgi:hypothetical protein
MRLVDRYIAPDGTVHAAPENLEEDINSGLLYLNKKAVNIENDGKLTPSGDLHTAAPVANDVVHRRINQYIVEPNSQVIEVNKRAVLSLSPNGNVFSNGNYVADSKVVPIIENENKLFLASNVQQEIAIIDNKVVPIINKQHISFSDEIGALTPKTERIKNKGEGISIRPGANPLSSFMQNFLNNYKSAQKAKREETNITDVKDLIMWKEAENMGLSKEFLQKKGHLDTMLQGKKTDLLQIAITDKDSGVSINTYARLSLTQDVDGKIHFKTNLLRNDLDLTQYCGHRLTNEDKNNLNRTGNLGRAIEVKFKNDSMPKKILLSLDKQTNELIAFDVEKIKIPTVIAGKELTPEQRQALKEGKSVKIDGMKSSNGSEFSNTLQFSALEKRFVFTGENPKIGRRLMGVELTNEQHSKLTDGEVVQIIGMTDKAGKKFNAYVRWDVNDKRLRFSSNPNFTHAKKAIPTTEHKTQVDANNNGYKPEALKKIQGPLEQKQPNTPTLKQITKKKPQLKVKL